MFRLWSSSIHLKDISWEYFSSFDLFALHSLCGDGIMRVIRPSRKVAGSSPDEVIGFLQLT